MSTRKRVTHISPTQSEITASGPSKRANMGDTAGTDMDPHLVSDDDDDDESSSDVEMLAVHSNSNNNNGRSGTEDVSISPLQLDRKAWTKDEPGRGSGAGEGEVSSTVALPPACSPPDLPSAQRSLSPFDTHPSSDFRVVLPLLASPALCARAGLQGQGSSDDSPADPAAARVLHQGRTVHLQVDRRLPREAMVRRLQDMQAGTFTCWLEYLALWQGRQDRDAPTHDDAATRD